MLSIFVVAIFLLGCVQKEVTDTELVDERLADELAEMSEEELAPLTTDDEEALAGQAVRSVNSLKARIRNIKQCQDSDNGKNFVKQGLVIVPGDSKVYQDYCDQKGLVEYFCKSEYAQKPGVYPQACDCKSGKCLN